MSWFLWVLTALVVVVLVAIITKAHHDSKTTILCKVVTYNRDDGTKLWLRESLYWTDLEYCAGVWPMSAALRLAKNWEGSHVEACGEIRRK